MSGHIENYVPYDVNGMTPIVIKVYNDLAGTVAKGDCYFLSYERDADSLATAGRPTLLAMATSAIPRQIVVALEDITDQTWGTVMFRGYCDKIAVASGVNAIDRYFQGANAAQIAADDGTSMTTDSFGIAMTAYASGFCTGYLFGRMVIIG